MFFCKMRLRKAVDLMQGSENTGGRLRMSDAPSVSCSVTLVGVGDNQ